MSVSLWVGHCNGKIILHKYKKYNFMQSLILRIFNWIISNSINNMVSKNYFCQENQIYFKIIIISYHVILSLTYNVDAPLNWVK